MRQWGGVRVPPPGGYPVRSRSGYPPWGEYPVRSRSRYPPGGGTWSGTPPGGPGTPPGGVPSQVPPGGSGYPPWGGTWSGPGPGNHPPPGGVRVPPLGGYPVRSRSRYPPRGGTRSGGVPGQDNRRSTHYTAGGMPLAFMQEDFLVFVKKNTVMSENFDLFFA